MPRAVPEADADGGWLPYVSATARALIALPRSQKVNPATLAMHHILAAYSSGNAKEFNQDVADYQAELNAHPPARLRSAPNARPHAVQRRASRQAAARSVLQSLGAVLLLHVPIPVRLYPDRARLPRLEPAAGASRVVADRLTLAVHTLALDRRIDLSGRPPVTNLYSSAVFIGWACVVLGIVLELIHRLGIGNLIASVIGSATLFVAHRLATDGDTLVVLQAVLDTQFWLGTHVVCITLGYATTLLAGGLGCATSWRAFCQRVMVSRGKELIRMMYGVLCFAIFFSFVGTVLGGLWADDSWGRFWGWDPKENGALIIVLWNALVLHARWGGLVKDRGLAVRQLPATCRLLELVWRQRIGRRPAFLWLHRRRADETRLVRWQPIGGDWAGGFLAQSDGVDGAATA